MGKRSACCRATRSPVSLRSFGSLVAEGGDVIRSLEVHLERGGSMRYTPPRDLREMIDYKTGNELDIDEVINLYRASTLGARRPIDDRERMRVMIARANLVVTAWERKRLVGIARSLSDFAYCTYLSDIAVDLAYQRRGIGRELLRRTRELSGRATILLFAAPAAVDYYPHIGFKPGSGWLLREGDELL